MLKRYSLSLATVLALVFAISASAETAGTVNPLAGLFAADSGAPRQNATVPISIHHGATFEQFGVDLSFAPNTFGTIFGPVALATPSQAVGSGSLVNRTMDWAQSFSGGTAPTNLEGVEVRINGKNAFIAFTGLGEDFGRTFDQINFISPDDTAVGPVTVEVFKDGAMVSSSMVRLGEFSPRLFAFDVRPDGRQFLAAVQATRAELVAEPDYFGAAEVPIGGVLFGVAPAAPGDVISLFGSGFGPTDPAIAAGQQLGPIAAELVNQATIRVGTMPATVLYAGLAPGQTGLYQFNITVPNLMDGNHVVEIDIGGLTLTSQAPIPVQAAP